MFINCLLVCCHFPLILMSGFLCMTFYCNPWAVKFFLWKIFHILLEKWEKNDDTRKREGKSWFWWAREIIYIFFLLGLSFFLLAIRILGFFHIISTEKKNFFILLLGKKKNFVWMKKHEIFLSCFLCISTFFSYCF